MSKVTRKNLPSVCQPITQNLVIGYHTVLPLVTNDLSWLHCQSSVPIIDAEPSQIESIFLCIELLIRVDDILISVMRGWGSLEISPKPQGTDHRGEGPRLTSFVFFCIELFVGINHIFITVATLQNS